MIVELFWERSENAIRETQTKYGRYCRHIAYNVLRSNQDADEIENDTYLRVWESIPPRRPDNFRAFLGRVCRNLALDRYDYNRASKRSDSTESVLLELNDCIPDISEALSDEYILREALNGFLATLPSRTRIIFMRRYFYLCSVKDIAHSLDMSESNVKVILLRTRNRLKSYLEKEGVYI